MRKRTTRTVEDARADMRARLSDPNYCFCGHEPESHDDDGCNGCAEDIDHGVDYRHDYEKAV